MAPQDQLSAELATFKRLLPTLLESAGHFAVIVGDKLVGTFTSWEDACKVGYSIAGLKPFLVKKIEEVESVNCFTRDVGLSCRI